MEGHNFIQLAEAQRAGKTLYCAGLDIHPFGKSDAVDLKGLMQNYEANMAVYGYQNGGEINRNNTFDLYQQLISILDPDMPDKERCAGLLAAVQDYTRHIIDTVVHDCRVYVFKPQLGTYIQLGIYGMVMLKKLREYIAIIEKRIGQRIIVILDCKPGDIFSTQQGYIIGFMGNLRKFWGLDYVPFDFDAINPTPYMGQDVFVLEDKKGIQLPGLDWLRQGKCMFSVNFTSNPGSADYQKLTAKEHPDRKQSFDRLKELGIEPTIHMLNAADLYFQSLKHDLIESGLSQLGLVVGATRQCDGSIRRVFPWYTGLNPGYGAQSADKPPLEPFEKLILELIPEGDGNKYAGQGNISSSSRGTMFAHIKKYGGTGKAIDLTQCLINSVSRHRELEEEAYELQYVIDAGIPNPFKLAA